MTGKAHAVHSPLSPVWVDRREDDVTRRTRRSDDLRACIKPASLVRVEELEYADVAFIGNGPDDTPIPIGVEIKSVADVLACIQDGRFAGHQLPGLVANYPYVWLIVEGEWRANPRTGILETPSWNAKARHRTWRDAGFGSRRWMARDLETWMLTISVKSNVRVHCVPDRENTARWIATLWWWWNGKEYAEHRAHARVKVAGGGTLNRYGLIEQVAVQLPGVGEDRAVAAGQVFRSVAEMISAPAERWVKVKGIGKETAAKVVAAVNRERERGGQA